MSTSQPYDPAHTIAFQGVEGAYADLACREFYPYHHTLPCDSYEAAFEAVAGGKAALGLIPIENSQAGRVAEIHALLPKMNLSIVAEHIQKISHHLLAPKGAALKGIKEVYSHAQTLMQCRKHLLELGTITHSWANSATAAAAVAKWKDPSKAAIASALAGEIYGLERLESNIQDTDDNRTLFVALAKEPVDIEAEERVLTTLIFNVRNIPAALYKALGGFATNGVNIIKLESYIPAGAEDQAQFFVTLEGNPKSRNVQLALEEVGFFCKKLAVLGVYPADPLRKL